MRRRDIHVGRLYRLACGASGRIRTIHATYVLGGSGVPRITAVTLESGERIPVKSLKSLIEEKHS